MKEILREVIAEFHQNNLPLLIPDFVAQYPNGKNELHQVSVTLTDEKTRKRELDALREAAKELGLDHAFVITEEREEHLELESLTIHILPYWKWALGVD